jgi:hypothetical protein
VARESVAGAWIVAWLVAPVVASAAAGWVPTDSDPAATDVAASDVAASDVAASDVAALDPDGTDPSASAGVISGEFAGDEPGSEPLSVLVDSTEVAIPESGYRARSGSLGRLTGMLPACPGGPSRSVGPSSAS